MLRPHLAIFALNKQQWCSLFDAVWWRRCWEKHVLLGCGISSCTCKKLVVLEMYIISWLENNFRNLQFQTLVLQLDIWIQCYHRGIWLSGGRWEVSLKLREICPSPPHPCKSGLSASTSTRTVTSFFVHCFLLVVVWGGRNTFRSMQYFCIGLCFYNRGSFEWRCGCLALWKSYLADISIWCKSWRTFWYIPMSPSDQKAERVNWGSATERQHGVCIFSELRFFNVGSVWAYSSSLHLGVVTSR